MYYEDESEAFAFLTGLTVGLVAGVSIALLVAPQSGKRTRRRLKRAVAGGHPVKDRLDDWSDDFRTAVESGRKRLNL